MHGRNRSFLAAQPIAAPRMTAHAGGRLAGRGAPTVTIMPIDDEEAIAWDAEMRRRGLPVD